MKLSEHFDSSEFACKCGCGYGANPGDIDPELIKRLERLREYCGAVSIHITSGCRCQAHDTLLDDDPGNPYAVTKVLKRGRPSFHILGKAADIYGPTTAILRRWAETVFSDGGIGLPDIGDWIHVDIGPHRRWTYPR